MKCKIGRTAHLLMTVFMFGSMAACTQNTGLPDRDEFERLADQTLYERSQNSRRTASEAVNFFSESPVTLLETGGSNAFSLTTDPGQKVPEVTIGAINAAPMQFGALLNQVAEQAGMSWRISGSDKDELLNEQIYFVQRNETMLETVLDELSELTEAFYHVEGDRIIFSQDRLFVARVPRMADSQEILVEGLETIGVTDIFSDEISGTVTFRATRPAYENAKRLMHSLEQGRDMIVYDFWIIDRDVDDTVAVGVDLGVTGFEDADAETYGMDFSNGGTSILESLIGGSSDSGFISGNLGEISVEAGASFLRSLGSTETVSRPTISMLSGGSSSFSSGETSEYIREVTTDSTDSYTSSGTDVETLEVGVTIDVEGAHNNGVISTDFEVEVSELISYQEFDTGDVTLQLPTTASRTLEAHLEARPGDVMVLGGIMREKETKSANEIPGTDITTQKGRSSGKTETIILVRPRLVQIRPAPGKSSGGRMVVDPGVNSIAREENPISDVIAEEGQAKNLLRSLKD